MSVATIQLRSPYRPAQPVVRASRIFKAVFLAMCFSTIAAVSAVDIWFAVENSVIMKVEKNPICLALIELDPNGFSYFVLGKSTGTMLVVLTLLTLHLRSYRHAMKVTIAVTCFQLGLLTYLTLSDPSMHNLPNFGLLFSETPENIWQIR